MDLLTENAATTPSFGVLLKWVPLDYTIDDSGVVSLIGVIGVIGVNGTNPNAGS